MVTLITWEALWYFDLKCFVWSFWIPKKKVVGVGDPVAMTKDEAGPWALETATAEQIQAVFFFLMIFPMGGLLQVSEAIW